MNRRGNTNVPCSRTGVGSLRMTQSSVLRWPSSTSKKKFLTAKQMEAVQRMMPKYANQIVEQSIASGKIMYDKTTRIYSWWFLAKSWGIAIRRPSLSLSSRSSWMRKYQTGYTHAVCTGFWVYPRYGLHCRTFHHKTSSTEPLLGSDVQDIPIGAKIQRFLHTFPLCGSMEGRGTRSLQQLRFSRFPWNLHWRRPRRQLPTA